MEIRFSRDDLKPIIETVITEMTDRFGEDGRLAFDETEAAKLIGVARHVLRDERLKGRVKHGNAGRKILYSRKQLLDFIEGRG